MMGHFNLPEDKSKVKVDKYFAMGPLAQSGLIPQGTKVWNKPKGITFVYGLLIGPGTGGGGGGTGGGGGGGSAGPIVTFLVPAIAVPDELYINVPSGGKGGPANTAGSVPATSTLIGYNTVLQTTGTPNRTVFAFTNSTTGQTGGGAGGTTSGAAGAGGTLASLNNLIMISTVGSVQISPATAPGQAGTTGAGANAPFLGRPQGGASGGGISGGVGSAGGNVLGPSFGTQTIWNRNLSGGAATGQAGEDGITLFNPTFFSLPGAGGGANVGGVGGRGGNGGIGSGGGGGGAGSTGGAGGDGGSGFVMLVCW